MGVGVRSRFYLLPVVTIAALSMGNQSCEEQDKTRVLKMEVELGRMSAKAVKLPNGETVDFPTVVGQLFYGQVMNNKHFVIASAVPAPQPSSLQPSSTLGRLSVSEKTAAAKSQSTKTSNADVSWRDTDVLESFGFDYDGVGAASDANGASQKIQASNLQNQGPTSGGRGDFGGQAGTPTPNATNTPTSATNPTAPGGIPSCLYNSPQALLGGDVVSFEAAYGGGARLGYGADGKTLTGTAGAGVRLNRTKLDLRMRTDDPLSKQGVALGDGIAYDTKVDVKVDFIAGFPIGLDFFYKTALADVIKKAMDKSLEQIIERYKAMLSQRKSWDDVWESRVIYDPVISDNDTHVAFRGGFRASVHVGDRFHITNTRYVWEGAACSSALKYRVPLSTTPAALVEVVAVGDNVSVAKIVDLYIEEAIRPGAMVKIESLKGAKPAEDVKTKQLAKR